MCNIFSKHKWKYGEVKFKEKQTTWSVEDGIITAHTKPYISTEKARICEKCNKLQIFEGIWGEYSSESYTELLRQAFR